MADEQSASSLSFAELLDSVSGGMALTVRPALPQPQTEYTRSDHVDLEILRATLRNMSAAVEELFADSQRKLIQESEEITEKKTADLAQSLSEHKTRNETLQKELEESREQMLFERKRNEAIMQEYRQCAERLAEQQELTKTMLEFRISTARKDFIEKYTDTVIFPRAEQHRLRRLFWYWRLKYLREWKQNSDQKWQNRLERTTKQVIHCYEERLGELRDQLRQVSTEREHLKDSHTRVAQSMKQAFLRSVAHLNHEALTLSTQELTTKLNSASQDYEALEP